MRILVVQDEGKLRSPLMDRFAARDITTDYAAGVHEAIMYARMMRYDAAVIDVQSVVVGADIQRALTRMQQWMKVLVVTKQELEKGSMPAAESEVLVNRIARSLNGQSAMCA